MLDACTHCPPADGDHPDESSTLSKLSKKSKPRSRSCERERGTKLGPGARSTIQLSARESEDSGNSSLNTYNTDTMGTNTTQVSQWPRFIL